MKRRTWMAGLVAALLVACGSDSTDPAAGPTPLPNDNKPGGGFTEKVGGFDLQLVAPVAETADSTGTAGLTNIVGRVTSASVPNAKILEVELSESGCQLLVPRVPFCETGCRGGVCVEEDMCKPNPTSLNLGQVTVKGLRSSGSTEFALIQVQNTYQIPGSVEVQYPPFDEGAPVVVQSAGAEFPAFTLNGRGIAPLQLPAPTNYVLSSTQPLELTWTPPGMPNVSRIHIKMDISHHGGSKGQIECDIDDDGAFSVPAPLIARLLALGVAGFPTVVLTRNTVATAQTSAGEVDLKVYMYQERSVEIPGLVSCGSPADCPTGQTCKADQSCG